MTTATPAAAATNLAAWEKILLAVASAHADGKPFTASQIVIAAWEAYPDDFGLEGFQTDSADSNKVLSAVLGKRGLVAKGYLYRSAPKQYQLTRAGREKVAILRGEEPPELEDTLVPINGQLEKLFVRLWHSAAFGKFRESTGSINFADACSFWDISHSLQPEIVDQRLAWIDETLNELEGQLAQQDGRLSIGRLVTAGDCRVLKHAHAWMQDRFEKLLNLLRGRKNR